jgi:CysZ protein
MKNFWSAFRQYPRAFRLALKPALWPLLMVPAFVSLLYFPVVLWLGYQMGDSVAAYVRAHLPAFLQHEAVHWLIAIPLWLAGGYLGLILFRNVVMILYSPVLGFISAKAEKLAWPDRPMLDASGPLWHSAWRGVQVSLLSLALSLVSLVFCWLLFLIPVVGWISTAILLPVIQMFLAGQGFMDPVLERRGLGVMDSFRFAWGNKWRVLGCGAGFALLVAVPVLGWFLGPVLGVIAGTLAAVDLLPPAQRPDNLRRIAP